MSADDAPSLAPEWRAWLAENLVRGVRRERLLEALDAEEVPREVADLALDELESSPLLLVARRHEAAARRLSLVVRLARELLRRDPTGAEVDRAEGLSGRDIARRYVATNSPVVLPDFARSWPALEKWSFPFFADRFGDVEVAVTDGREADPDYDMHTPAHTRRVSMRDYVARILATEGASNDFYMVAQNRNLDRPELAPLLDDLAVDPELLDPGRFHGSSALWLGPAGTVTPLHHDTSNILFCQVRGTKRFLLASPAETSLLHGARSMYAGVDPEGADGDARLADVRIKRVDLEPGECLFLPVGWWHHVRALTPSISVALNNFTGGNDYDWYRPGEVWVSAP